MVSESIKGNFLILNCPSENIETELRELYKDEYLYIYDYIYKPIGNINFIYLSKEVDKRLPKVKGTTKEKIDSIVEYVKDIQYNETQPNPNKVFTEGGNCHATSVLIKYICDYNKIPSEFVDLGDHLYVRVKTETGWYRIDATKQIYREEY